MATPQTVAFHTLGCKLNFSETSSIKRSFEGHGFTTNKFEDGADIYVINTCSVTDFADRKCRKLVRDVQKISPQAKIVMIGCYAQLKPEEISNIEGVDLVLGASEKFNVVNYIDSISKAPGQGMIKADAITEVNGFESAFSFGDRTRSFLKVQDGCDYKCTFCTIPQARGKSRSDTVENVVTNAKQIADLGIKEIVLTGVNIGDFGLSSDSTRKRQSFLELIQALDKIVGINRFRISSIEPNLCSNEIIEFVSKSERFVPHFHMPLQSGSDDILKLMKRRYKSSLYQDRVKFIKTVMPHCCIGVDVIVGFPGETDEHFNETYQFINELDISYLHVFTYSERANTPAVEMEGSIPMAIRRERNEKLRILSQKKRRVFYDQHVGEVRPVLFESSKKEGIMNGFTDNYIKIEAPLKQELINAIHDFKLSEINSTNNVTGSLVDIFSPV